MPVVTDVPLPTATPAVTPKPTARPTARPTPVPTPEPTPEPTLPVIVDEPLPTVTPEPVFVEAAPEQEVHGLKAEYETPIVETVIAVVESIAAESETTIVRIAGIEKIVTEEEKIVLNALPIREQLLVTLSAIGFDEAVSSAVEGTSLTLSEEAQAVRSQIQERISAMTETEKAEFETLMMENFPTETIEIDGVEYTFFVLDLEIIDGDEIRYERYGFRFENGEWLLTRLFIEADEAE